MDTPDHPDHAPLHAFLDHAWCGQGLVLTLTGAGISAESGIPTFRGKEGYWRVGSRNYVPEQLATLAAFSSMPDEIWGWYLYRRSACRRAVPNAAHEALARLERELVVRGQGTRFLLVTQNVDGLHLRAGNSPERTYQIHGNIDFMRSVDGHDTRIWPLPEQLPDRWPRGRAVGDEERRLLCTPDGTRRTRPHVLWFDECYDEQHFRFESALEGVEQAGLLLVVGTSGSTNLPSMIVQRALARRVPTVVLNQEESRFTELAERSAYGHFARGKATDLLPPLLARVLSRLQRTK